MKERPKTGWRGVLLVWIIGLTLGVAAGSATAMLLMPKSESRGSETIAERLRAR